MHHAAALRRALAVGTVVILFLAIASSLSQPRLRSDLSQTPPLSPHHVVLLLLAYFFVPAALILLMSLLHRHSAPSSAYSHYLSAIQNQTANIHHHETATLDPLDAPTYDPLAAPSPLFPRVVPPAGSPGEAEVRAAVGAATEVWEMDGTGKAVECVVCLDEVAEGLKVRRIAACGHAFHQTCVDAWLFRARRNSCPLCSRVIVERWNKHMMVPVEPLSDD